MKREKRKYTWSRSFGVPAQVFGEIYYSLKNRNEQELVRTARSPRSPLHKLFEWDDKAAAQEHRLVQARVMISSLQVEIIDAKGKPRNIVAFVRSVKRGGHVPIMRATREDLTSAMQECWKEMVRFRARYRHLEIVQEVIHAINSVERRMSRMKKAA